MTVTALSAGNSLVNPTKGDIFASEETILHALAFVRHSAIPTPKKNSLRDLFLAYAGTADQKEQGEVQAKIITELESQPELSSLLPKEKLVAISTVGMSRPVPSFNTAVVPEVIPTAPIAEIPVTPVSPPVPKIKSEPTPPVPPPTPEPVPVPAPQTANAKARIDAIKRDINGRVGNPVNLIETNEKVGREYMNALLDAMKRSSRGDGDLTRLETAYQAALGVISKNPAGVPEAPVEQSVPAEVVPPPVTPPPPVSPPIEIPPEPEVVIPPVVLPPQHDDGPKVGLYHRPVDEVTEEIIKKLT